MSPEKDQEYFCDGIAEELITVLNKIPGLRIAARTSTLQFRNHQVDIRDIGQQLNVNTILEGSVRKSGNRIRITAELIDTLNGYHLWSEKYDRNLEDIFVIQDEIAGTIADTLKMKLDFQGSADSQEPFRHSETGASRVGYRQQKPRAGTLNMDAYSLYLKGRHYWRSRRAAEMANALECFEGAIQWDPNYAMAYAGIADCYSMYGFYAVCPPAEAYPNAMQAAEKALQI